MIELSVLKKPYYCRTKDQLWYRETGVAIDIVLKGQDIVTLRDMSSSQNIFNAASPSRASETANGIVRRLKAVDRQFLEVYQSEDTETQKLMCIVLIMLTDHTFYSFMNEVYREKLITESDELYDRDFEAFIHDLQGRDARASKWKDGGIHSMKTNMKYILSDADMITERGDPRRIVRPLLNQRLADFLKEDGLIQVYKILEGERA